MAQRHPKHVALAICPRFRHVPPHPGYSCAMENALRARITAHLGPRPATTPAAALVGTTFGPGPAKPA